jgi:hypothetical protein
MWLQGLVPGGQWGIGGARQLSVTSLDEPEGVVIPSKPEMQAMFLDAHAGRRVAAARAFAP